MTNTLVVTYPGKTQEVKDLLDQIPGIRLLGSKSDDNKVWAWATTVDEITVVLKPHMSDWVREILPLGKSRDPAC
ncbi:hypothetical protein A3D80_02040 [Candidatus Roizmanbacteria bacterium RIFCSPHIGHO2_02_FULL_40_13b]|uniref:Uncharacterized protein n=1 Tax=Candidatus Roizmanbacteria bacterium RIFCSPHIGHO2_01_FULL_39_24 TaxID=1802032 RepID=A0A1F7GL75_9BACT|nr:MAG: hypothetical protein A2799_01400 [Candidatus Roizmanbacteria bacterium RIFCSPHIGHO2_01_FULL_39_24]OGK26906.1 MAG: hypothetical protein A3D80_02040 [Candidatus Roizmanbacteria bacterium RIFCSPHIGHO2_02_FULL_40_13b]OGK49460.1 MAG: hypothetical protein A3A56_03595 [Candidatus Roizmanbacteria bacterium RIFCSPLOWO2_01_FULL_40_32]OGK56250.1 MAG: hypothetical protein A3H83_02150 [Candidatus Roizmanbacteria bacterium RIFCSPLOWO2_02_FULL_39_8]